MLSDQDGSIGKLYGIYDEDSGVETRGRFIIAPEEGFGDYREDLQVTLERTQLPTNIDPKLGMRLEVRFQEGDVGYFIVTELTEDDVTLDGNHPLAGQEIVLKIELLEIL